MKHFLLAFVIFLTACASPQAPHQEPAQPSLMSKQMMREILIGTWFGEHAFEDGTYQKWISKLGEDGRYEVQFEFHNLDKTVEQEVESGIWAISGGILFKIFQGFIQCGELEEVDPTEPENHDAYRILELTKDTIKYTHMDNGITFDAKRVADDSRLFEQPSGASCARPRGVLSSPAFAQTESVVVDKLGTECQRNVRGLLEGVNAIFQGDLEGALQKLEGRAEVTPKVVSSPHGYEIKNVEWHLTSEDADVVLLTTTSGAEFLVSASFTPTLGQKLKLSNVVDSAGLALSIFGQPEESSSSILTYYCMNDLGGDLLLVHLSGQEVTRYEVGYHID